MNKESRDTSSVLSEFWHDWGERRLISSGGSMAYEYAIRGCPVFALTAHAAQVTFTENIFYSKFNGCARSYWGLDRVRTQSMPLRLEFVEFNPYHMMHRPPPYDA